MIICIDVDDTIANLQEVVVNRFNKRYNTNYSIDDFHDFEIENVLSMEQAANMKAIYAEHGLYSSVKPVDGAQDAIRKLIHDGHQVYIVSASIPHMFGEKFEWVKHFFPFVDDSHIISMAHKWLIKCDVMIDDNMTNLLGGVHYERIVIDKPWNQKVHDDAYGIYRCFNWDDVIKSVIDINEKYKEWNAI